MALQERAIRTRRNILVAAADVFADVGYEAATISEILQRANVTKGALYFHFASKEQLAQAVLTDQLKSVPESPPRELGAGPGRGRAGSVSGCEGAYRSRRSTSLPGRTRS
ncbi:TetR family transcriptional regulator, partial [Streptomyces sp. SAS_269]|uniref:TetR family transcriptional regulator n=1 Tax=Streptomyces sp. SAS_269 TaxID=3412749 RepID=UPI00403C0A13